VEAEDSETAIFLKDRLDVLAERRRQTEESLAALELATDEIRREAVDEKQVRRALAHIGEICEGLPPFRRKELIRLVLDRAEVSKSCLRLAFRGRPPEVQEKSEAEPRSETPDWTADYVVQLRRNPDPRICTHCWCISILHRLPTTSL
jgi:hypothetical protein